MYRVFLFNLALMTAAPASLTINETNMGQTIQIEVGEAVAVKLKGNPTTGYNWDVAALDETVLKQVGEAQFRPDSTNRGSGGKVTLRFEAVNKGKTSLRMIYHRPFEKNSPPVDTFEITVEVK